MKTHTSNHLSAILILAFHLVTHASSQTTTPTTPENDVTNQPSITDFLADRVDIQYGAALTCLKDASCNKNLKNETDAVVLLMAASSFGGRFCTGTLINNPYHLNNSDDQLIITANHCRASDDAFTIATLWGVVFDHNSNTCTETPVTRTSLPSISIPKPNNNKEQRRNQAHPLTSPFQILQGLEVVFADEISDILILRLTNTIPSSFRPYYLGWDAQSNLTNSSLSTTSSAITKKMNESEDDVPTTIPSSSIPLIPSSVSSLTNSKDGYMCIHHDAGDVKKISSTALPLQWIPWKKPQQASHVLVNWTDGVTEVGSSGATLLDGTNHRGLGVLTGGSTPSSCRAGSQDMFGTFLNAWDNAGLWKILSPLGQNVRRYADGYRPSFVGRYPGLIATPPFLQVQESAREMPALKVRLSDPSPEMDDGEIIFVNVVVVAKPESGEEEGLQGMNSMPVPSSSYTSSSNTTTNTLPVPVVLPVVVSVDQESSVESTFTPGPFSQPSSFIPLQFTSADWNRTKTIDFIFGDDDAATGALKFDVVLEMTSSKQPNFKKERIIHGVRADQEIPKGLSVIDPVIIPAGPTGYHYQTSGSLLPTSSTYQDQITRVGDVLQQPLQPGWITFYNITPGQSIVANLMACSRDTPLQVVVYKHNIATWLSTEDSCTEQQQQQDTTSITTQLETSDTDSHPRRCTPINTNEDGCSGFLHWHIPSVNDTDYPHTITIRAMNHGAPARYSMKLSQITKEGELFVSATRSNSDGGGDDSYAIEDYFG